MAAYAERFPGFKATDIGMDINLLTMAGCPKLSGRETA